ncbi:MAG: hypothetical protein LOD87_11160 [Planifilum fulgidum]
MDAHEAETFTVFVEYRIDPSRREMFLRRADEIKDETARIAPVEEHEILEGCDQPGLFVEVIRVKSREAAGRILHCRREPEEGIFLMLSGWVSGKGIQAWAFSRIKGRG